ncbi:MAG TPA: oligopeptide/dipeptide ABC transporter ATP-binding protein [Candidatus Nanopelagicales bacterium]|nr:oligopeptide/dipeptide ABC transporter ATP-binding protein [Candidatus Nanopelagicales bacterium]
MLTLDRVGKTYKVGLFGGKELKAVQDVSFDLARGEVVSLIGESGSGKSTIGRMILRLLAVNGGTIRVDDVDVSGLKGAALRDYYRRVQGVFQDPFSSCNPIFKVDHLFALLRDVYFRGLPDGEWRDRVAASLATVNLESGQVLHKFPHQLSGGQVQRLLIARALILDTEYLVADEIISMLDASTRIDVLNLLGDLKTRGLGILFITHDLSLGNYISERTVILRRGRIVEMGTTSLVFGNPLHPYTKMLLASIPHLHDRWGTKGEVAAAWAAGAETPLVGPCLYHAVLRGRSAEPDAAVPSLVEVEPGHRVGCRRGEGEGPC